MVMILKFESLYNRTMDIISIISESICNNKRLFVKKKSVFSGCLRRTEP